MKRHFAIIGGETVQWTERGSVISAFHHGFAISVERIIPKPEALTEDRVVIAMAPRMFRVLINGAVPEADREFAQTFDEAIEIVASAVTDIVTHLEAAMTEFNNARSVRYEDWA